MKVGLRKPNYKKRLKARTIGKAKRKMKKAINPLYGKKGMGYIKNPKRALKNKVYHKTTRRITMFDIGMFFITGGLWIFVVIFRKH